MVHKSRPQSIKCWVPRPFHVFPKNFITRSLVAHFRVNFFSVAAAAWFSNGNPLKHRPSFAYYIVFSPPSSGKLDCEVSIVRGVRQILLGSYWWRWDDRPRNTFPKEGKRIYFPALKVKSNNKSGPVWWRASISQTAREGQSILYWRINLGRERLIFLLTLNVA